MQIMLVSEEDMLRGGEPEDCQKVWIMNPFGTKRGYAKEAMFKEKYAACVPVNKDNPVTL